MIAVTEASDRSRRLRHGIAATFLSRTAAIVAPLVTIPLALDHLDATAYGAWSAALALTGFAVFADLGLGAGLMTRLTMALSSDDVGEARRLTSSAYLTLAAVVLAFTALLWTSSVWVDYGAIIGRQTQSREVNNIVLVTLSIFLANIVASVIVRVQFAAQQIGRSSIWQGMGSVAGIVATAFAASIPTSPPVFIIIASGLPLLVAAVNSVHFFSIGAGRPYAPSLRAFRCHTALCLLQLGSRFLLINVLIAASTTTDNLIVSNTTSLATVPEYAIPARVFAVMAVVTAVLAGPMWPINVEALARGDVGWVKQTTRRMAFAAGAAAFVLGTIGVLAGPYMISIWVGGAVVPSTLLLAGLATALFAQSIVSPFFMVQNAAAVLAPQIVGFSLLTLTIPIKWLVSSSSAAGFEFIPLVTAAGYIACVYPAVFHGYKKALVAALKRTAEVHSPHAY